METTKIPSPQVEQSIIWICKDPLKGKNISDLITLIESGDTYVNVRRMFNFDGGVGSR